jgi:hypothetical protein
LRTLPGFTTISVRDASAHIWDVLRISFNENATEHEDLMTDAIKPTGADFNFYSLTNDYKKLAIDSRPYNADKAILLGLYGNYIQDYVFRVDQLDLPLGGKLVLHDKLLNQFLPLVNGSEYRFSVTADTITQGDNRFELKLEQDKGALPAGLSVSLIPNPANDEVTLTIATNGKDEVSIRISDLTGIQLFNKKAGVIKSKSFNIALGNYASGVYLVEVISGKETVVKRLVKE